MSNGSDEEVPERRPFTREDIAARVEKMSPEEQARLRKIAENALGLVVPDMASPLARYGEAIVPIGATPDYEAGWNDGESPYEISQANAEAAKKTAALLGRMIESNEAEKVTNRKIVRVSLAVAIVSCAAAIVAAVVPFLAL
ncbi:hypothetical protein ACWGJ9_07475 [Curtobacterium citreum]